MDDDEKPRDPPATLSMLDAARRIGVAKSTMHRYIESGKVSATKLADGKGYEISSAELYRAFPDAWAKRPEAVPETPERDELASHGTHPETALETAALRTEVRMLREMLDRANLDRNTERRTMAETIEDLRERLTKEGEERRAINAQLLTYQTPPVPPVSSAPQPPKRGGLFGLFRKAG